MRCGVSRPPPMSSAVPTFMSWISEPTPAHPFQAALHRVDYRPPLLGNRIQYPLLRWISGAHSCELPGRGGDKATMGCGTVDVVAQVRGGERTGLFLLGSDPVAFERHLSPLQASSS